MDSRDAVLELILELLAEDEFRAGPCAGPGAAGLPARLAGHAGHDPDLARRSWRGPRAAADDPAGQGRLLGPRARPGRPARLVLPGLRASRPTPTPTSSCSRAGCSTRGRRSASRSPRTTCARSRTRSPTTASPAAPTRPRAAGPARARRPAAGRDRRPGPARAHVLPRGRPRRGYGVPRAAAAGEHLQRVVPLRAGARRAAGGAARAARRDGRAAADDAARDADRLSRGPEPVQERADPRAAARARSARSCAARWRPSTPSR